MIFNARIGAVEMMVDTDQQTVTATPEWTEDVLRRVGRQCLGMYNALPDVNGTPSAEPDLEIGVTTDDPEAGDGP